MADLEDQLERELHLGRKAPKAKKAGGGKGNHGANEMNREVAVSKALSKLLRHAAADAGLTLDPEGFARVDQVMAWPRLKSLKITFQDIQLAVQDNAKQRFSMKANPALSPAPSPTSTTPSDWVIRANQGHSISTVSSELLLTPLTPAAGNLPAVVVHGTYFAFYEQIVASGGLKKMSRNHIHFSTGIPGQDEGVKSGMRNDAELLIYIDIEKCFAESKASETKALETAAAVNQDSKDAETSTQEGKGIKWWMSENGVVLTEGDEHGFVPTRFWKKVVARKEDSNIGTLWEDGVQVKELPEEFKGRKPPMGKGRGPKAAKAPRKEKARGKEDTKLDEEVVDSNVVFE
ncbi:hypothetical protein BP5796_04902 [Coleophoma crateriformis]|uniref:2'-phosphotransferase n=1 Tax=Coleophoma crateriformis TaxID=565419 RepID=A0A3D8SB78_9HELO|nr:hypothetical protein BP5796_04902 [Coleophoma crateriformis]